MNSNNPYLETNYTVDILSQPIRINEFNQELNEFLKLNDCINWAYITAHNPFSKIISNDENIIRNKKLESQLSEFKIYNGRGCGIDGNWPPEESFLILGIARNLAIEFGEKFEQNAIVYGIIDGVPELIMLSDSPGTS